MNPDKLLVVAFSMVMGSALWAQICRALQMESCGFPMYVFAIMFGGGIVAFFIAVAKIYGYLK